MTKYNLVRTLRLDRILPTRTARGQSEIDVAFEVDASGILKLFVSEKSTGNNKELIFTIDKEDLSKSVIERMFSQPSDTKWKMMPT